MTEILFARYTDLQALAATVLTGVGAPSGVAPQGTLYLRTDGSSTSTRAYISLGGGSWTNLVTAS